MKPAAKLLCAAALSRKCLECSFLAFHCNCSLACKNKSGLKGGKRSNYGFNLVVKFQYRVLLVRWCFVQIPFHFCCFTPHSTPPLTLWPHLIHVTFHLWLLLLPLFLSLLLCLCPSLNPRPPNLPSYTLCLTHLLSARQVSVAKRQAMSYGLLLTERRLSIMISQLPLLYTYISLMGVVVEFHERK